MREPVPCCTNCHTPENHQEGALLWGYNPKSGDCAPCAWMNPVRWYIVRRVREEIGKAGLKVVVHTTFGAATRAARAELKLPRTHGNDACATEKYHPAVRAPMEHDPKHRRNSRRLEKFHDARYIDIRDGTEKTGKKPGCNRTSRREPRRSDRNLRHLHGQKTGKGCRQIRRKRSQFPSGTAILLNGKKIITTGMNRNGATLIFQGPWNPEKKKFLQGSVSVGKAVAVCLPGGWVPVMDQKLQ